MAKEEKTIAEELEEDMQKYREANKKTKNEPISASYELLQLFIGIILICVGLFMFSRRVVVQSNWFGWRIGGFNLSSGTVTIPLIIGIIWYFFNTKSVGAKLLVVLSIILIIVSVIMSLRINFITSTMFDYVLMFGMMAAGAGLCLRVLFKKH